tara:strand:+ start:4774 stop:5136 length:363 start_codon:yes stop_codon:yes gene_type:complete
MALYVSSHPISWTERWCGKIPKKRKMATNENKKAKQSTRFIIFFILLFSKQAHEKNKIFPKKYSRCLPSRNAIVPCEGNANNIFRTRNEKNKKDIRKYDKWKKILPANIFLKRNIAIKII